MIRTIFGFFSGKANNLPRIMSEVSRKTVITIARWMGRNSKAYAKEGFQQNVITYRCVQIVAEACASIPLQIKVGSGEDAKLLDEHPLLDVLRNPNPIQTGAEFVEQVIGLRRITGKVFVEKIIVGGTVKEMWAWPDYHMKIKLPKNTFIPEKYVWDNQEGTGTQRTWKVDPLTGACDLYNWSTFNPFDIHDGTSPIGATAYAVDQHNSASEWNKRMLDNSAEPSGILTHERQLTPEQIKQLDQQLQHSHAGPDNARKTMILSGGLKWQQVSLSPRDMDWLNGKNASAQDIAAGHGVPLQVIPLPGSQTYANYEEARLALWEDTVIILFEDYLEMINRHITPSFGDNIKVVANLNEIPALSKRRQEEWDRVASANHISQNEKRLRTGYQRYEESEDPADWLWMPSGMLPLNIDAMQGSNDDTEEPTEDDLDDTEDDVGDGSDTDTDDNNTGDEGNDE